MRPCADTGALTMHQAAKAPRAKGHKISGRQPPFLEVCPRTTAASARPPVSHTIHRAHVAYEAHLCVARPTLAERAKGHKYAWDGMFDHLRLHASLDPHPRRCSSRTASSCNTMWRLSSVASASTLSPSPTASAIAHLPRCNAAAGATASSSKRGAKPARAPPRVAALCGSGTLIKAPASRLAR